MWTTNGGFVSSLFWCQCKLVGLFHSPREEDATIYYHWRECPWGWQRQWWRILMAHNSRWRQSDQSNSKIILVWVHFDNVVWLDCCYVLLHDTIYSYNVYFTDHLPNGHMLGFLCSWKYSLEKQQLKGSRTSHSPKSNYLACNVLDFSVFALPESILRIKEISKCIQSANETVYRCICTEFHQFHFSNISKLQNVIKEISLQCPWWSAPKWKSPIAWKDKCYPHFHFGGALKVNLSSSPTLSNKDLITIRFFYCNLAHILSDIFNLLSICHTVPAIS